jgi:lipopolysaccharide/colanic/teichoic acid biosynthesis glycosyltransferase
VSPTSKRRRRYTSPQVRQNRNLISRFSSGFSTGKASREPQLSIHPDSITQASFLDEALVTPIWKRVSDFAVVLLILPLIAFFALIIYCWIKLVSPGHVLFRQTRIGRGGKPFTIYKFRSMKVLASAEVHEAHIEHLIKTNSPMTKLDRVGDSRLIKGGCLIRNSGLDELPQFINVLRGEMSLVGPRPCLPKEFDLYSESQRHRFAVQPGLTGQWQVNRTETTTFSEMVRMDDDYVDQYSLRLDLKIILKTPMALCKQVCSCAQTRFVAGYAGLSNTKVSRNESPQIFAIPLGATQKLSD